MGLQYVCANFMRIVNSPVLYMSEFFPIRIATGAYVCICQICVEVHYVANYGMVLFVLLNSCHT